MKLVIIIPALNEEKTIGKVISSIPKKIENIKKTDIVVINDGSTDKTAEISRKLGATVIENNTKKGVGAAFESGIKFAISQGADIAVNIDADGQFDSSKIEKLIGPIVRNQADMVTCSRFKNPKLIPKMPISKIIGNKLMSAFISKLIRSKVYDVSCGYRAFSKEAILNLNLFGKFTYTQESFLNLSYKGLRILEVPMIVKGERQYGESRVASNLFAYTYRTLKIIFRSIRDYKPLKFFGSIGILLFIVGLMFDSYLLYHWLITKSFSPYKSFGFIGAFLNSIGFVIIILALVADLLDRLRLNQEKLLYYEKKREYERKKN